ncbi:MAG: NAD regulator [Nitriliruptorales bacterium]
MPRVLTLESGEPERVPAVEDADEGALDALPFGGLDLTYDRTLELGLRRWVSEQTGMQLGYVEQLYTFGDRDRDPRPNGRVISIAYLALMRESPPTLQARWRDLYRYLPWEDWREGRPLVIDRYVRPTIEDWVAGSPDPAVKVRRRDRAAITFGLYGAPWDRERVLERYELLYEVGLVSESLRARRGATERGPDGRPTVAGRVETNVFSGRELGRPMALDHRRMLATALGRLRGKLRYRPVVFELLPPTFTLLQLQRVVEALSGVRLHKQNFRRLVERGGLVEGTGELEPRTGGRPAELFRFRRDVLRERPVPGIGVPELRGSP